MSFSVSAKGETFEFSHISISFIDKNGVSTPLGNSYIEQSPHTITTNTSSPDGYYSGESLFTNDIILNYCYLFPAALRDSVAFNLHGLYTDSSVDIVEDSVFYFQFLYITEFYFNDLSVSSANSPVKAYVDLGVLDQSGLSDSGSIPCAVVPTYKGILQDPADTSISLYVYDCLCAVSGSQLINNAETIDPDFTSLYFSNIRFIQSGLNNLEAFYGFGFSKYLYVSDVPPADASLQQQKEILDRLDTLITMQSGVDTQPSIDNFNSVDSNYQDLEDSLINDYVGDSFQDSVSNGNNSLTLFGEEYSSAFALIGALLGKSLNLQGLNLIITILLTFIVIGFIFNIRFNSIGSVSNLRFRKRR